MYKKKTITALAFLLIHSVGVFYPGVSYALTSGPATPESSQFQPASVTNMVDPFTGDFSYNIPLLDVDGYPINIAYNSGGGMDEEASWVGFGWTLNPGSVSRIMKGLPDDFNGTDKVKKEYNIRPDITGGLGFNVGLELFGLDFIGAKASADIFYNNQRGVGVEVGAGITASLNPSKHVAGEYTGGLSAGGELGITSNSQTGANFNFGANLGISTKNKENQGGSAGLRFGGSLNSRAGLKSTTLGVSFNTAAAEQKSARLLRNIEGLANSFGSATTSYGMAFTPTISMPMKNESYTLSPQVGGEFWGLQGFVQVTGHYTKQSLAVSQKEFPAYGFLHSAKGKNDKDALLDFNREKDVPYTESTPTLPVPYVTPDLFTATSNLGSSQFRANSGSTGVFFDSYNTNNSDAVALGVEFGAGAGIKIGVDLSINGASTVSRKWENNNDYLNHGDFSNSQETYFKLVGEKSSIDKEYLNKIANYNAVKVKTANVNDRAKAFSTLASNSSQYGISSAVAKNIKEPKGEMFVPLTAERAASFALDKTINNYRNVPPLGVMMCDDYPHAAPIPRRSVKRKDHHLSELKVIKNNGSRLVYGLPVYNNEQVDITMSVANQTPSNANFATYDAADATKDNSKGIDHYFSKETIPAYATSFLLTGVCSPDYVDVSGNGISDDDLGTAVKFNYSLINDKYNWRTPNGKNASNYAIYNQGNRSDKKDDKASFSYGSKEIWYTHSIESKNMIAVFRTSERADGLGYMPNGALDHSSKLHRLDRIDLYSKSELMRNHNAGPVKSVHFVYDYSLFGGVPNNASNEGKLTLKEIYFTYANSSSGQENRYKFTYSGNTGFEYQQYDRWGSYKNASWNNSNMPGQNSAINLDNNDYPYTVQNKAEVDKAAGKWQLSQIELPSGGKINVSYESDDYAFVQDRRAMQMAKIVGYGSFNNFSNYQQTDKIFIQLPAPTSAAKIKADFFDGVDQLYFKSMISLTKDAGTNELVSGFAKVKDVRLMTGRTDIAEVTLEKRGNYHPIAAAGWQYLRNNLPQLAYPYQVNDGLNPMAFVKALIAAIGNVGELLTPFESKAMRKGYASSIEPNQGFARITTNYRKFGGGSRVRKITMDDVWSEMVGSANGESTSTGMLFEYTRELPQQRGTMQISSGVASYEPMAGGDENPFRQPITYQQKEHLTSSIYTVEEPLGESYFPAPSVGYSQVIVKNLNAEGKVAGDGYNVKKFYTAKDFPTIVKRTDLSKNKYNQSSIFGLFNIDQGNSVVLSQGFYVETNDMHGKPMSDETFDPSGKMIAGSYYHYRSNGTERLTLDNNVTTLKPDGKVGDDVVGVDYQLYTDMREQLTENSGVNINVNVDILFFAFVVVPIPNIIPIMQNNKTGYEAASTIKVVNRYGILDKVTTIENGSTSVSENVLWDALTGDVLLTKTQNNFNDPLYNFSLPAYMVNQYEKGMGAAYMNTGIVFSNVAVSNGVAGINSQLIPGDELGVIATGETVWANNVSPVRNAPPDIRLINKNGSLYSGNSSLLLLRSGRRNMMEASTYSVVSLKNPIRNGIIDINASTEILNTSVNTFSDEWTADCIPKTYSISEPVGRIFNPYFVGTKGNWRSKQNYVYDTKRSPKIDAQHNGATLPTNTRKGGVFELFTSFYKVENGRFVSILYNVNEVGEDDDRNYDITTDKRWIATVTSTKVNGKGQEVESKDALNKYSSVQFGYNKLLATAVASNARNNEIGYDGFEDRWLNACKNNECDEFRHFGFFYGSGQHTMETAHTGNYSLKVSQYNTTEAVYGIKDHVNLTYLWDNINKYTFNQGRTIARDGATVPGFMPWAGKKYIISGWIKGDVVLASNPNDAGKARIIVEACQSSQYNSPSYYSTVAVKAGPKVEGWTRVMAVFEIPQQSFYSFIRIKLSAGTNAHAWFDDIRIQPYDASMKSFVYDDKTFRLMAELDENNYASFYEYSDEGELLRKKKETEKGIVTINETRNRVRKNN